MNTSSSKKALIAMSGGVDSSVAAHLISSKGYQCIGCTMKLYERESSDAPSNKTCCSLDDVEDARSVAYRLGMPYYVFNFKDDFEKEVISRFVSAYENGATPNPCIDCNKFMKFDKLYERAQVMGCDYVVTGHYAKIEFENGKYLLKKAADEKKDQSYVLYALTQEQLAHTLLPLGTMEKSEIRLIAEKQGFVNAKKPDSQDICFVPDGDYAAFVENYTKKCYPTGSFVLKDGTVMGKHKGIIHYTIGQRRGLGLALPAPLYVCKIDPMTGNVVLGTNEDLFSKELFVRNFNWISGETPEKSFKANVKIRYRQKEQPANVTPLEDGRVLIVFDEPQRAITKGQAAVLYSEDIVLGGGVIE